MVQKFCIYQPITHPQVSYNKENNDNKKYNLVMEKFVKNENSPSGIIEDSRSDIDSVDLMKMTLK